MKSIAAIMICTSRVLFLFFALALAGCRDSKTYRPSALPDNVMEDRPIVLKEGQAVILIPEGNKAVMIGASVVDGKLTISEIDSKGRSFSVSWNDQESWLTAVLDSAEDQMTAVIDKNGDGLPDLRVVKKKESLSRFTLEEPKWIEVESRTKTEQTGPPNP